MEVIVKSVATLEKRILNEGTASKPKSTTKNLMKSEPVIDKAAWQRCPTDIIDYS